MCAVEAERSILMGTGTKGGSLTTFQMDSKKCLNSDEVPTRSTIRRQSEKDLSCKTDQPSLDLNFSPLLTGKGTRLAELPSSSLLSEMGILNSSSEALASMWTPKDPSHPLGPASRSYGAVQSSSSLVPPLQTNAPSSPALSSPRRDRSIRIRDLEDLTEEEDEDIEDLIDIPYETLIRNYALVPISSFLFMVSLALLFTLCWRPSPNEPRSRYPYRPHWGDFFVGCAAWVVSYALRLPIYTLATFFERCNTPFVFTLSTILHIFVEESLRLSSLILLGLRLAYWPSHKDWIPFPDPQDDAFRRTFWYALGWALVEVCWSISQGYEQLSLYRDLLSREKRDYRWSVSDDADEVQSIGHRYVHSVFKSISPPEAQNRMSLNEDRMHMPFDLEGEMTQLIAIQHRNELEMVYGVPPPNIPVFISILQRLDSILLAVGLTLIMSATYLSQLANHPITGNDASIPYPGHDPVFPPMLDVSAALVGTLPTFVVLTLLHAALAVMWTEALPRIGVHTASYTALLVALGVFFAGLASWGALA